MKKALFLGALLLGSSLSLKAEEIEKTQAISTEVVSQNVEKKIIKIDLKNAFNASPIIYSILAGLSVASMTLAFSAFFEMQKKLAIPKSTLEKAKEKLITCHYDEACQTLESKTEIIAYVLKEGIASRKLGYLGMKEVMKEAGKRQTVAFWQRLSMLSDIAIIAPMIGLLGTVLGMFYAFYDVNRSIESLASLFDGLGVSVGTTVAGLLVALLSMFFQTVLKHRLLSQSQQVEAACETVTQYLGRS